MYIRFIVLAFLLASCSEIATPKLPSFTAHKMEITQGNMITAEMRSKLKVGMTRSQVKAILGTPLVHDAFHANRWDYVYSLEQKGKLVKRQRMTLYFEGENLARIDDVDMPVLPATAGEAGLN